MHVELNVRKTKAKFWPPLQDIHCHGNHLSFGKALRLEKQKKHILRFFGEGTMEKTKINIGKKNAKTMFEESLGRAPWRKPKTIGKTRNI